MFLKNKVVKNAGWIIIGKIIQSLLGLIINLFMARYLGSSNYGIISYAASVVAFAVPLMSLGVSNVLVQEVTDYPDEEGEIFGSSIVMSVISSIACIIGIGAYTFIADRGQIDTNIVVILYSAILIFQAFDLINYWFQAKLLSKWTAIATFIAYIIVSTYKIILLVLKANIYFFAISNAFDYLIISIILLFIYRKLGGSKLTFNKSVAKRIFNSSKYYIISSMMVTIFAQIDKVMLKHMINEASVGCYQVALTLATASSFVFIAIIDSMRPVIFEHKKKQDEDGYEKNICRLYSIIIYLSLIQSVIMTIFSKYIILFLYGDEYNSSISALQIIVWFSTFSYIGSVRNIWILGEKKQKFLWIINLCGAALNIGLNYAFINLWGVNGAAAASLITQFFTNIVMSYIIWPLRHNNYLILKSLNPKILFDMLRRSH